MSLKALYSAATGMEAQETKINTVANNLANINTAGFKADRASFEDLMYDQLRSPGALNGTSTIAPTGIQIGHGTRLVSVYKQFSQGEFTQTNRELDLSVEGNGFFRITQEDGTEAYTRDGSFRVNAEGILVNDHGLALADNITIPQEATSISIGRDGTVSAAVAGQTSTTALGQIQVAVFQNPSGLRSLGQNLFQETDGSGTAVVGNPGEAGAGGLVQGFLENSNVNVAEELISMIIAQRSYEANSKVLQTTNEMMRTSSNAI